MYRICGTFLACIIILSTGLAGAGDIESPGTPASGSGMYSLAKIYEYLTTGVEPVISSSFLEPTSGPAPTGKTIEEIYDDIKALFDQATATPGQVLSSVKFFSTDSGSWGATQGTMPDIGPKNYTPGTQNKTIDKGYHDGTGKVFGDADLVAGNISSGVNIFGVVGTADVAVGNAATGDVLSGKTFSNDSSSGLTGTMTNVGTRNFTPGTADQTITQGYHDGTGKVAGDADLVETKIKDGVKIFGVTGNFPSDGTATTADVLAPKTFYSHTGTKQTGNITSHSGTSYTPTTTDRNIPAGYHNGTTRVAGDADLVEAKIKDGESIFGVTGNFPSDGTATTADVLPSKTFYSNTGNKQTGNMTSHSGANYTPTTTDRNIPAGYHDGTTRVDGDDNLVEAKIKDGESIFGVTGNFPSDGTATTADVLPSKTFYSNTGNKQTGNMTSHSGANYTPTTTDRNIPAGYHDGTTRVDGDDNLVEAKIKDGESIFGVTGNFPSDGTATTADVLPSKTFYSNTGNKQTGNMTSHSGANYTPTTTDQNIPAGYHDGTTRVDGDDNLVEAKIKDGESIFGVTGNFPSDGTATTADVLPSKTFYSNTGTKQTGNMTSYSGANYTPTTTDQNIPAGYHDGTTRVDGDDNLVEAKIKDGESIFGVTGNFPSDGTALVGDVYKGKTFYSDNAEIQTGTYVPPAYSVVQPVSTNRFVDNGNGTIRDQWTGLIWLKDANCFATREWTNALADANGLADGSCGLDDDSSAGDWRLPNINELLSILDYSEQTPTIPSNHPFTNVQWDKYWSSTTYADSNLDAWSANVSDCVSDLDRKSSAYFVWPVRDGQ